ncbi:hypothetical protein P9314_07610 [Paenibacillus validus]|uniref:hypothetical protein n=1 Tax=Paenibacillus validus TaxID=44253 RepID=UPI000FDCD72F|nr:hypothetical protein [Paenibacillus validus]MED4600570.1 hypothetical protein [Paenibacillus validus]MED4605579.1 hypothetical protein [Paenibacillus validus]
MKGLKWLMKLAVTAAVTSICCVALTFMAVNTYVDLVLEQLHIQRPATAKIGWGSFFNRFTTTVGFGAGGGTNAMAVDEPKDAAVSANVNPDSTETGSKENQSGLPSAGKAERTDPYRVPEDAVAVWGQQSVKELEGVSGDESGAAEDRKVVVSSEEFTKKKEQLSEADKAKVFSLLVSRIPQQDMQTISQLMEDGLTAAEIKELEQLLQKHLKPEEYRDLLALIQTP